MNQFVNSGDRDDPANYVSFDNYVQGASRPLTTQALARAWNAAHPDDAVEAHGDQIVSPNAPSVQPISADCTTQRVFGAIQLVGGTFELFVAGGALLAPEPTGATKVIGWITLVHGLDTVSSAVASIATCERSATFTEQGATALASVAGASPETAQTIGIVTDVGVGVGGSLAVGMLSRAAPRAGQLVHLTNPTAAEAINATQTLGRGGTTLYAGSGSLANARGWQILARTGLNPARASEVVLLPSRANEAFLLIHPLGPFSAWQRISGAVYSAGAGTLNLQTGVFTRAGPALNQLAIYGFDTAVMATVRGVASGSSASQANQSRVPQRSH